MNRRRRRLLRLHSKIQLCATLCLLKKKAVFSNVRIIYIERAVAPWRDHNCGCRVEKWRGAPWRDFMVHLKALALGREKVQDQGRLTDGRTIGTTWCTACCCCRYGLKTDSTKLPGGGAMQNVIELIHHDSQWLTVGCGVLSSSRQCCLKNGN